MFKNIIRESFGIVNDTIINYNTNKENSKNVIEKIEEAINKGDQQKSSEELYNEKLDEVRSKFLNKFLGCKYSDLLCRYFSELSDDVKTNYDKELYEKHISSNFEDINTAPIVVYDNYTEIDVIDLLRYYAYYVEKNAIKDPIRLNGALSYKVTDNEYLTVNDITYSWSKRKNYFNEIIHNISFYDIIAHIDAWYLQELDQEQDKLAKGKHKYICVGHDDNKAVCIMIEFEADTISKIVSVYKVAEKMYAKYLTKLKPGTLIYDALNILIGGKLS